MEGDVIVMQDVFVFEQTGIVEGKIQGRLKPTGIRPEVRREVRGAGASTCRPACSASPSRPEDGRPIVSPTILVAAVAALAILLIAVGIATSGRGSGVTARLERYASGQPGGTQAGVHRPGPDQRPDRPIVARSPRSTGSSSSATSGPTSPATSPGRTSSSRSASTSSSGRARSSGIPRLHVHLRVLPAGPAEPDRAADRGGRRVLPAALLRGPAPGRPAERRSTSSCRTRSRCIANALRAGSSFLQAIELVVRESRPPISTEFERVIREVNLGLAFDEALQNMVRRVRVGRPGADGHGHLDPAPGRRQPGRDPRLDRLHDPRAGPDQGRDPAP